MANFQLMMALLKENWLVGQEYSNLFKRIQTGENIDFEKKSEEFSIDLRDFDGDRSSSNDSETETDGKVAIVPLVGVLQKRDSFCSYGTQTIADKLISLADDGNICAIVLDIDSSGGEVASIPCMLSAIEYVKSKSKPIIAHVDICCSAAYWIASACDSIFLDNNLSSTVGSIGALCHFADSTGALEKDGWKIVEIYAPQSKDKNKPYLDALNGDHSLIEERLSGLVQKFHFDVKKNRPMIKTESEGVFSGATFTDIAAIETGLADDIQPLSDCIVIAYVKANINS